MASPSQQRPPAPRDPGPPLSQPPQALVAPPTLPARVEAVPPTPPVVPLAAVAAAAAAHSVLPAARPEAPAFEVVELTLDCIDPNPDNSGGDGSRGDVDALADSIKDLGLLQAVRVRPSGVPGRFILINGHRRWLAQKKNGAATIMAQIDRRPYDPLRNLCEDIAENLHREGIPAVNLARTLKRLQEQGRFTLEQLAAATNTKVPFVSRKLSLLRFSPDTQDAIAGAASDESVFIEIAKLDNAQAREALAARALKERLTQEQAVRLVEAHRPKRRARRAGKKPLKRLTLPLGAQGKGGLLTLAAADDMAELTAAAIRDALEFALQEVRAGLKQGVAAAELPAWLAQRAPKARPAGSGAGERRNPPPPALTPDRTP